MKCVKTCINKVFKALIIVGLQFIVDLVILIIIRVVREPSVALWDIYNHSTPASFRVMVSAIENQTVGRAGDGLLWFTPSASIQNEII